MRRLGHLAAAAFAFFVFVAPTARAGVDAGWMFDPAVVVDVDLTIPQSSMDQIPIYMEAERPYVPATFSMTYSVDGNVVRSFGPWEVTLKVKGMYGSFRALPLGEKAGLKIKFPSGRRPDGLKKFTLNNMVQDGTKTHEVLAYEVFRAMGVAAPRAGYARVTINGTYYGIYLNLETLDNVALPRWFPTTGHLYEGSYGSWWGDVGDAFSGHYEVDEGDENNRDDLQTLLNTARNNAKGWYARMAPIADLEQMTRMWACEWFTGHWDGYSQFITNNYYLHADANGRFSMIPWGTDQTFSGAERFDTSPDHFIFNGCMRDPIGRAMYTDALQEVAVVWESLQLAQRADAVYASVASESEGVDWVKWFVEVRLLEHRAWAATLPAAPQSIAIRDRSSGNRQRIEVSWTKPTRTGAASPEVQGYAVEYRTDATPWVRVETRRRDALNLSGLAPGTYTVRVRAMGKVGDSLPATTTFSVADKE